MVKEIKTEYQATVDEASILFNTATPTEDQVLATSLLKEYFKFDEIFDISEEEDILESEDDFIFIMGYYKSIALDLLNNYKKGVA